MKKQRLDPDTEAALEIVEMENLQAVAVVNDRANREQMIAECNKAIGRVQTSNLFSKFAAVSSLVWLRDVKSTKLYRDIPGVGTWDKFCDSVGMSRAKVDEDLVNLSAFGEDFLLTCQKFSLGYRDLRKLRQLNHDGAVLIEEQAVVIGGESIPLDSDHRDDLQAAIERVLDERAAQLADADASLKAKTRILESKEQVINKQEREIAKHEARAAQRGFAPGEETFLKQMAAARITLDGFLRQYEYDPADSIRDDLTPRMKAALLGNLAYFRKVIIATHEAAKDLLEAAEEAWDPDAELAAFEAEQKTNLRSI